MKIPLVKPDLPSFEAVEHLFRQALETGRVTNFGKYLGQFEEEAAAYLGSRVTAVSSGTLGLTLTLQALGLNSGGKVILPSFSFVATAQAVLYAGGIPVFADVADDLTMDPSDLASLLARHPDVEAVMPVHTYGLPCRIEELRRIAAEFSRNRKQAIRLVFDAAHAFGSCWKGRKVGGFGDAEVFSLSVTKALVSVEGGLVASPDEELIRRVRKMCNYGIEENYDAHWPGMNGKMSELHAIVGLENLRRLDDILSIRERKAAYFARRIHAKTCFRTIPIPPGVRHTFKDFTLLLPPELKEKREMLMRFLDERGIETRAYFYPPIHEQKFFRRFADRPLPITEDLSRRVVTLPFFTSISEQEMEEVTVALQEAERMIKRGVG